MLNFRMVKPSQPEGTCDCCLSETTEEDELYTLVRMKPGWAEVCQNCYQTILDTIKHGPLIEAETYVHHIGHFINGQQESDTWELIEDKEKEITDISQRINKWQEGHYSPLVFELLIAKDGQRLYSRFFLNPFDAIANGERLIGCPSYYPGNVLTGKEGYNLYADADYAAIVMFKDLLGYGLAARLNAIVSGDPIATDDKFMILKTKGNSQWTFLNLEGSEVVK